MADDAAMTVFLFRHGATAWNSEGRLQGHTDTVLSAEGEQQALDLAPRLRALGIDAIVTSDLQRAYQTAEIIAGALAIPLVVHEGFREVHQGEAQGMLISDIDARFGTDSWRQWSAPQFADFTLPGAGSKKEALAKADIALHELGRRFATSRIAICTHGFLINLLAWAHGIERENDLVGNGEIICLTDNRDGKYENRL